MKIEKKYTGKWVAISNKKVVASESSLKKLTKKTKARKDQGNLRYTLVPNGFMAG